MHTSNERDSSWLDKPIFRKFNLSVETFLLLVIIILAVFSRFYDLESRVMSHDENSHVYYSWRLFKGEGFAHDPLMHGPLQFHMVALSYFIFGDNDFTARIPAALFSIATVLFMWNYRRYLGRSGALIAAMLMLISPYMLYYGRYVRNEAYVALLGVATIWAVLRYFETGKLRYLYWLTIATVLHFTAKETAFIYTAQILLFLVFYFVYRILKNSWQYPKYRNFFLITLLLGFIFLAGSGAAFLWDDNSVGPISTATTLPTIDQNGDAVSQSVDIVLLPIVLIACSVFSFLLGVFFSIKGYSLEKIRAERSFDLLILVGTLVLPQLSAFPIRLLGWTIPTNATQVQSITTANILQVGVFLVSLLIISLLIGLWWNPRKWLVNAGIFYGIFILFYTTIFTNGAGFFTGIVGSLGYWLEQQGVNRGSQPWYYYGIVQIPIYEYLPAIGTLLLTILLAFRKWVFPKPDKVVDEYENSDSDYLDHQENLPENAPSLALFMFWAFTSLVAYSIAGEKMPWLTVHITWPLILCASWFFGKLIESIDWKSFQKSKGWLVIIIFVIFFVSSLSVIGSILGDNPPFQGKTLDQLGDTSTFFVSLITAITSGAGLYFLLKSWSTIQIFLISSLTIFGIFSFLTARTAVQAAFINYDDANELLVYAHSAGGVKAALDQIEEISQRTTDGLAINVAYDNETSYPYWWYLRNYSNAHYFGADPTRSLRDSAAILVGDANYGKIEPVVGQAYNQFDYIRLWWPNQDYYDLTWERIFGAIRNPEMRAALFQIWLNRDYSLYGQVTKKDMSLPNWSPSAGMRLYIRKDIVNQLWNYGAVPAIETIQADPYEGKEKTLAADKTIGTQGDLAGQFNRPRGIAVAGDGSIYVADTDNHRIQHLSAEGKVLHSWGQFGDVNTNAAPGSTFNQPWGIAVGPDGSVYVADTWNHRVQKFSPEGEFLTMWGFFGQAETPKAFWGPRDIDVDEDGLVFITDTGNKRVVVFDEDGNYVSQFGETGLGPGQFDEPVGISIGKEGNILIADTWNQRVQEFSRFSDDTFVPEKEWEVIAWFGQSLDNKPFIDVDAFGNIFASDPEGYRVLMFDKEGEFIQFWGDFGTGLDSFGMPSGIAIDEEGGIWVSDTGNHRLMHFSLGSQ